jgi:endonuclease/exonuclease/phosphatase family metal-dependent hydrolase
MAPSYINGMPFLSVFGLFFPVVFFANLFFTLFWLFFSLKRSFISLVFILISYNIFLNHFAFNFGNKSGQKAEFTVVSYNVHGFSNSKDKIVLNGTKNDIMHFLVSQQPDIVCLQEFRSKDRILYGPLKETGKDLNAGSYYFQSYYGPKHNELTGMVIFSKFKKSNTGYLRFEGHRTFCIYSDLLINGDTVRVVNIHLASVSLNPADIDFISGDAGNGKRGKFNRIKSIYMKLVKTYSLHHKQIKAVMDLVNNFKGKVIVCGDMNDTPGSYSYNYATRFLNDAFKRKGSGMSVTYANKIPFLRIDYIMTRGKLETVSYKRSKVHFSDHFPVSAGFISH